MNIVYSGTVVCIESKADQREDQGLQKSTPEMQIMEHDGCLL